MARAPAIIDESSARTLAHTLVQEALECAELGAEEAQLAKSRAEFQGKVAPELHHLFDEVLAQYEH